jgi:hypothetical protein
MSNRHSNVLIDGQNSNNNSRILVGNGHSVSALSSLACSSP